MKVGIVGATGVVGKEILKCLQQRSFPLQSLDLLASARSAGTRINGLEVKETTLENISALDVAFFSAGSSVSKEFVPFAARSGCVVIDNSSLYRRDDRIRLVVPELSGAGDNVEISLRSDKAVRSRHAESSAESWKDLVVANPNCAAILLSVVLSPIHRRYPLKRVVASTYHAASGAGARALEELRQQAVEFGRADFVPETRVFGRQYLWNCFSHNSEMCSQLAGYNGEEEKMIYETKKLLGLPGLQLSATCIRVPVLQAHSESVNIEFQPYADEATSESVRKVLSDSPGVEVVDDRVNGKFPEPLDATGEDNVLVGRIREDAGLDKGRGIELFIAGDQLRKGAALNAVQCAERLL